MISLSLIYDFLMIGLLSFGGGYTTIPMVKDLVDKYQVLNIEMLENFIAISESTPGPIAINLATFVGNEIGGVLGGVLATLFEILPAFFIILIFVKFFKKYIDNDNVKFALSIIRPCIVGIIMTVGLSMFITGIIPYTIPFEKLNNNGNLRLIAKYLIIAILVIAFILLFEKLLKKKLSSIKIIILGAILGIAINCVLWYNIGMINNKRMATLLICALMLFGCSLSLKTNAGYIYTNPVGPGFVEETKKVEPVLGTTIINVASSSKIYIHDGIAYVKGEDKGRFSLSGFCACKKCGSGTGLTASGKPVRENHTIASDWKVLPKGTVIILENAVGKDGQVYDGVYVVEDRGGGVKNNHIDIYRPTHELASLVTHYGRAYGNVYIAEPYIATKSDVK